MLPAQNNRKDFNHNLGYKSYQRLNHQPLKPLIMELLFKKSTLRAIPFLTLIIIIAFKSWAMNIATPTWQIFLFYGVLFSLNITALYQIYKSDKAGMKNRLLPFGIIIVLTVGMFIYQFISR